VVGIGKYPDADIGIAAKNADHISVSIGANLLSRCRLVHTLRLRDGSVELRKVLPRWDGDLAAHRRANGQ